MRTLRTSLVVACAALAAALPAPAFAEVKRPAVTWLETQSYTKAQRKAPQIRYVVIHVTEGSFWGSVEWLRNPRAHASSHYVISRQGKIVQMVRETDVAWHAGNKRMNELSTGIEHEGMTYDPAGFTTAQYQASARLVAYIARRSLMPITRRHIIGHDEVPHPSDPSKRGGASAHTDPGPHWDWDRYLRLVRRYAAPTPAIKVDSATVYRGQTIAGTVPWQARTSGPVTRVDFLVNGKLLWRSHRAPFRFAGARGLNTTTLRNGRHVLELRAFGPNRAASRRQIPVVVRNAPFVLTTAGLRPKAGARLWGVLDVRAAVRAVPVSHVELLVDGRRVAIDRRPPYRLRWDARRGKLGPRLVVVRAVARDGRVSAQRATVLVARPDPPAPVLVRQSVEDGQVVSGVVEWQVGMTGRAVRIEFLVDGALRRALAKGPLVFAWDTSAEQPGPRTLTVRLIGPTGKVTAGSVSVTVAPPEG
jgi:N-acetyl-anhydromuramyl-L-alanine amidase AmpD